MKTWNPDDYRRIELAIRFLDRNATRQPDLEEIARAAHLSAFHFQRLFKRWAGVTPKRFLQILTVELAKERLAASRSVLDTAWDVGLSGPGRLHDLFVAVEAVTPGEFKARGAGLSIRYGFHATPFGLALLGVTERGVCHLAFVEESNERRALAELKCGFPAAQIAEDAVRTARFAEQVFQKNPKRAKSEMVLHAGTNFQAKVWNALLRIPPGAVATYGEIACAIGKPKAVRAVGHAVARNSVAYLIPCHRVIRSLGVIGHYRWGPARKRIMLAWEAARRERTG
ncbi:MAG: methylated-DNA--[protein]-cysteine S-methyltransferase [Planctomycetes bacterium]|nr:methylated-DNA--[protein]-cysteine S-methyltransferase [Planctomycetota bacterium]